MGKIIILAILSNMILAGKIKPRVIHVHDNVYRGSSGGGYSRGYRRDSFGMSSIDASSQVTIEVTSIATLEGSSQATSGRGGGVPRGKPKYYKPITFLKNNRDIIMEDISKGDGEHIITLLKLMKLKRDNNSLSKIQKNFNTLLTLDTINFIYQLEKLNNS